MVNEEKNVFNVGFIWSSMKFEKLLHPEIAADKNGEEFSRKIYKTLLRDVDYCKEGFTLIGENTLSNKVKSLGKDEFIGIPATGKILRGKIPGGEYKPACFVVKPRLMELDENSRDHFCLVKKFQAEGGKVFHINKDFLSILSEINREIPIDCLPEKFLGYISFAEKTIKDDTGYIQGAYVYIGDARETVLNSEEWGKKVFWCSYVEEGVNMTVTALRTVLEQKTMQELIAEIFCYDYGWKKDDKGEIVAQKKENNLEKREIVFRTLINSIIYIHCQNPVLDKVPAAANLSHSQRRKIKEEKGVENKSAFPVTFLNWRFQRPVVYTKDKTSVIGHFRRQHYGPGNKLVKAIYIEEHERILNKLEIERG